MTKKYMETNVNNWVKVKLNDSGLNILRQQRTDGGGLLMNNMLLGFCIACIAWVVGCVMGGLSVYSSDPAIIGYDKAKQLCEEKLPRHLECEVEFVGKVIDNTDK